MKTSAILHASRFVFQLVLIAGLTCFLGRPGGGWMPQVAQGEDVLSVVFGDAREVLSRAAVHKADSYFHGGVDMDCGELHEHGEGEGRPREDARHTMEHEDARHTMEHADARSADPWAWINSRIRAPEIERHLEGGKAVELMPWFWVAVKADPHNAEAWASAWYSARYIMKDRALATRVLEEACAKNPESIEIAFTGGRAVFDGGKGDKAAARGWFRRAIGLADAKCKGDVSKLTEREEEALRWSRNYLELIDKPSK